MSKTLVYKGQNERAEKCYHLYTEDGIIDLVLRFGKLCRVSIKDGAVCFQETTEKLG